MIKNLFKMEDFSKLMAVWLTPILIGIVGFFVVGILTDVKEIKAAQNNYITQQAVIKQKLESIQQKLLYHEKWLDEVDQEVRDLERRIK